MDQNADELQIIQGAGGDSLSLSHPIQVLVRFLRTVLLRREILIVSVVATLLLGLLYFATATRRYVSTASLLVLQTGQQDAAPSLAGSQASKDKMPAYISIAKSDAVLIEALKTLAPGHRGDFGDAPPSSWPKLLRNNLSIHAGSGDSVVSISYQSEDAQSAAAVVDAVLEAYLTFMRELYQSGTAEVADLFNRELYKIDEELGRKSQEKLYVLAQSRQLSITDGEGGANPIAARVIALNTALIKARHRRIDADTQLTSLEYAIRRGEGLQQYAVTMLESTGNEFIKKAFGFSAEDAYAASLIRLELLKDEASLQSAKATCGKNHPVVVGLEDKIRATEDHLDTRRDVQIAMLERVTREQLPPMLLQFAQQELEQAAIQEDNLRVSYEEESTRYLELGGIATQLETVEYELATLRDLKQTLLERLREIEIDLDNGMLKTKVLKDPEVPTGPATPRLVKTFALALFLGVALGLAVIYVLDLLDDRFRSPEEIQAQLGVPVLAMVRKLAPTDQVGPGGIHVHAEPTGVEAESFRTLRTALAFAAGGANRLVVTSTESGDGKTTISVNLGSAIAQSGKRTLLIDADMRRPGLTPLLNLRGPEGLSAILRDSAPLTDSVGRNLASDFLPNLDVIPSGARPANPMELLASDRFSDLLAWAETVYDQIIIDSPPVLAVSDSAIIGRLVDGVVLTIRPERNRRRLVVRAIESFPPLGVNVLGIVINNVDAEKSQTYYGYGYGYSYDYGHENESEPTYDEHEQVRPHRVTNEAA